MIHPNLYSKPVTLDTRAHGDLRVAPYADDWSVASGVNAIAVAVAEFADLAVEFPLVFVKVGNAQGGSELMPVAVFGLTAGENLYVEGKGWRANHLPMLLRMYPFGIAGVEGDRVLLAIDEAWPGWSRTEGEPLFESGQPTERTTQMAEQIGKVAGELRQGAEFAKMLDDAGLLMETRFEAKAPNGETIQVDGFYSVDAEKLAALNDQEVLSLWRNGAMALVHAHQLSMRHMARLADWRLKRQLEQGQAGAQAPAAAAAPEVPAAG